MRIVIILAAAVLVTLASRLIVNRFRKRLEGTASITQELNLQRATTLTGALSTALIVVIWVLAILMALGEFHQNIAPLLASAGVAGVALGFGAQSLVRDTLSGFFILLENQFGVGDNVEVQTPSNRVVGRVESLTLRVTSLRAFDGTLHFVPTGTSSSRATGRRDGRARPSTSVPPTGRTSSISAASSRSSSRSSKATAPSDGITRHRASSASNGWDRTRW